MCTHFHSMLCESFTFSVNNKQKLNMLRRRRDKFHGNTHSSLPTIFIYVSLPCRLPCLCKQQKKFPPTNNAYWYAISNFTPTLLGAKTSSRPQHNSIYSHLGGSKIHVHRKVPIIHHLFYSHFSGSKMNLQEFTPNKPILFCSHFSGSKIDVAPSPPTILIWNLLPPWWE